MYFALVAARCVLRLVRLQRKEKLVQIKFQKLGETEKKRCPLITHQWNAWKEN